MKDKITFTKEQRIEIGKRIGKVPLRSSYRDAIALLSTEEKGELLTALYSYFLTGEDTDFSHSDIIMQFAWEIVKADVNDFIEDYYYEEMEGRL